MKGLVRLLIPAAGAAATIALLWLTDIPLGIPGEWTWTRIDASVPSAGAELVFGVIQALLAAAMYLGLVGFMAGRLEALSRRVVGVCVTLLVFAGFAWLWLVQDSAPGLAGLHKSPLVLYAPETSGYFFHARYEIEDVSEFLRGYKAWVSQGDVLHFGTHPPGLFLFHHALNRLCEASPGLTQLLIGIQPDTVRDSLDLIAELRLKGTPALTDSDRASLWLAALLTQLAGALTVVPLYLALRRTRPRGASFRAAALWLLVPALAIFLPKSDCLYPFLGMLFLWCWLEASDRRSMLWGGAAGLVLAGGMLLTLAFLPIALLGAVLTFVPSPASSAAAFAEATRSRLRGAARPVAGALAGFALPLLLLLLLARVNPPAVWIENYHNHAAFYDQFTRTTWKWVLANPIELAIALGWPLTLMALTSLRRPPGGDSAARAHWMSSIACAAVWGLLWLSGKNSGEAARLWLILMPWGVWMAGARIESPRAWWTIASLQAGVCIVTVLRVTGFQFGG